MTKKKKKKRDMRRIATFHPTRGKVGCVDSEVGEHRRSAAGVAGVPAEAEYR
jgi:hypothetical protein